MRTLKAIAVLFFSAALFFSCELADSGAYGTLVINLSSSSARAVKGVIDGEDIPDDIKDGIKYLFECKNIETGATEGPYGPYAVGKDHDVPIKLSVGTWVVAVKVLQDGQEIGSSQYPEVAIKAGQTVILGGIDVKTTPYGRATAHKVADADFKKSGYQTITNPIWETTSAININRHLIVNKTSGMPDPTPDNYYIDAPEGTAHILWDNENLYVKINVTNAACVATRGSAEYDTDSVEIFINDNDTGHQYRITYDGKKTYAVATPKSDGKSYDYNDKTSVPENVAMNIVTKDLPSGVYVVVAKIPFKSARTAGGKIGIDFQINGAPTANGGKRSSVTVWYHKKGQVYNQPNLYKDTLALLD